MQTWHRRRASGVESLPYSPGAFTSEDWSNCEEMATVFAKSKMMVAAILECTLPVEPPL